MIGLGHGQVWWADLDKIRPVVILTRSPMASRLRRVLVAPITTTVRDIPTEITIGSAEGVRDGSVVNLDNSQLLWVDRLLQQAGNIPAQRWPEVCRGMAKVMACPS